MAPAADGLLQSGSWPEQVRRPSALLSQWQLGAGPDGTAGAFELQFVTEDEQRHSVRVAPQDVAAVLAMTRPATCCCGIRTRTR